MTGQNNDTVVNVALTTEKLVYQSLSTENKEARRDDRRASMMRFECVNGTDRS